MFLALFIALSISAASATLVQKQNVAVALEAIGAVLDANPSTYNDTILFLRGYVCS